MGGLLVIYLGAPVALFVVRFAQARDRGFHVPGLVPALLISLSCATVTLVVVAFFGVPLAYVLGRSTSRWSRAVEIVVTLPLALPPVIGGIIVVYLVGPYSYLGRLFHENLTNSVYGIVIAMTFCAAPFLILSARAAFSTIDQGLLDVAATLGHGEFSRFIRVAVPVAGPEIRAGMTMTWLRAFGEYGAVTILAFNPASLPIYTVNEYMARGIAPTLAPTMLALVVAGAVVLVSRARLPRLTHVAHQHVTPAPPTLKRSARLRFDVAQQVGSFRLTLAHESLTDNLAVVGPSGSGKSVLLRSLAGLYGRGAGHVDYGDDEVDATRPEQRSVGYVAQGFGLFPHLTVWRQLMFPTNATAATAMYWLDHLGLAGLENRFPAQLSGGQRQRVALAQALCHSPDVLLLDEPFSALDRPVRRELQRELRRLQRETGLATVIVTHDPEEAALLASEVIVISDGRALQSGSNRQVFSRPGSREIARLLGISNLHRATTIDSGIVSAGGTPMVIGSLDFSVGTAVLWTVRPERLDVRPSGSSTNDERFVAVVSGTVTDVADVGTAVDLYVRFDVELELHVRLDEPVELHVGDSCDVLMKRDDIDVWFDAGARTDLPLQNDPAQA